MKKVFVLAMLAIILSSCGGKMKKDQIDSVEQAGQTESDLPDANKGFDVINNEAAASDLNKQTQASIEEVEVADRVFFDLNSSSVSNEAKKILDNQVAWLKSDENIKVVVEGHCDERGTREYNIALGEKRANSVKQYLISSGVSASRVKTISYGKERPDFVGNGEDIWTKNRRSVTVVQE